MRKIISLLLTVITLVACESNSAQTTALIKTVTVAEFQELMKSKAMFQLLDVRTSGEYMEEHLENAVNYDYNDKNFTTQINQLDKNIPTFLYCLSGGRSNHALDILQKKGFREVYNMKGGILEWKGNQLPLTKVVHTGWKGMTKEEFETIVQSEITTLIDFRAKWCGPCKQLKPILDELQSSYSGKIKIVEIDIDDNKSLAEEMRISNIPLLMVYRGGKVLKTQEGFVDKNKLIQLLGL